MRQLGLQQGVEDGVPGPAVDLRLVHRRIGIAQHVGRRDVAETAEGDADAGARLDVVARDPERPAQHVEQPLGQRHGVVVRPGVVGEDGELVAPEASDDVFRADALLDSARDGDQELVADGVAEAVVDQLEAIEVEEHQAEMMRRLALGEAERLLQVVLKAAPVRQPRQAVVEGDVLEPGLGLAPRGDILDLEDQAGRRAFDVRDEAAVHRRPDDVAFVVAQLQLDRERVDLLGVEPRQATVEQRDVGGVDEVGDETLRDRLVAAQAEQPAQGLVRLHDAARRRHQRHADRSMREGAVEASLARLELAHVACAELGFALDGVEVMLAHGLVRLLLAKEVVKRGHEHRCHRHGDHQHDDSRLLVGEEQQAGDGRAADDADADPAEVAEHLGRQSATRCA